MSENYIEFVDKIFERSDDPVEQLERMFDNHPLLFFIKEVYDHINEKLKKLGYQLNKEYVEKASNIYYRCGESPKGCSGRSSGGCSSSKRRGSCKFSLGDLKRRGIDRFSGRLVEAIESV